MQTRRATCGQRRQAARESGPILGARTAGRESESLACKVPDASWTSTVCPSYTTWPTRNAPIDLESYSYDYKNRLTTYRRYGIQGQLIDYTVYTYDALDRSVAKSETHYANDGWGDPTTTTTNSSYEGDSSRVIEETLVGLEKKTYAYDAFGSAISLSSKPNSQAPASRYSYLYDPGSSVSLLVDSAGAVQESYGYSAYGSSNGAISKKASGFSTGSVPTNPVRFQGKMFDSGSGSYDMGARRYSASAGRWLSQDMYSGALDNLGLSMDPLTANRYAFLGANPVNYVEVDGHTGKKKVHYLTIVPTAGNQYHPALSKTYMDELTLETSGFYEQQGRGLGVLSKPTKIIAAALDPRTEFKASWNDFRRGNIVGGLAHGALGVSQCIPETALAGKLAASARIIEVERKMSRAASAVRTSRAVTRGTEVLKDMDTAYNAAGQHAPWYVKVAAAGVAGVRNIAKARTSSKSGEMPWGLFLK